MSQYADSVFINCPFSPDYKDLFRAVVFAVADCGFIPRCALEQEGARETRIEKLFDIVRECGYGVHDISATDLDAKTGLPRFNMPLELGIFLGARAYGSKQQQQKSFLILDSEEYRYRKFCSDLAGYDPKAHSDQPAEAIRCIRDWLRGERRDIRLPSGDRMFLRFERFRSDLPLICEGLQLEAEKLPFIDLTAVIEEWLLANPR